MTKLERLIKANELIHLIATTGRKFFNSEDKNGFISKFEMKNGRTYFVDGYNKKPIYAYDNYYFHRKFSQGGTMQALILDIAEWIRSGKPTNGKSGYGGVYCDHWGYPSQDMANIQRKAKEIGFSAGFDEDMERSRYIVE